MISILLVSTENDTLSSLASCLQRYNEIEIFWAASCQKAFDMISEKSLDLAVADENIAGVSGLEFAEKLVSVNPMINRAVVSPLSSKDFHEASEGLGVMMQLPVRPDEKQAEMMIKRLKKILNLIHGPGKPIGAKWKSRFTGELK